MFPKRPPEDWHALLTAAEEDSGESTIGSDLFIASKPEPIGNFQKIGRFDCRRQIEIGICYFFVIADVSGRLYIFSVARSIGQSVPI